MVKVTHEMLMGANTYIPILEKAALAEEVARKCVLPVHMRYQVDSKGKSREMPDGAQEMPYLTSLCLMGIFASKYLRQGEGWDDDIQMPANVFDEWGESHVMNQMERLKTDKAVSAVVYDILHDYKELRWMVRQAIETKVRQDNDVVCRMHQILKDDIFGISDLTPEILADAVRSLEGMNGFAKETRAAAEGADGVKGGA